MTRPSSLSLAQSIAARILDTHDPALVHRIGLALRQAIAEKRLPVAARQDRGGIEQECLQYPLLETPPSPIRHGPKCSANKAGGTRCGQERATPRCSLKASAASARIRGIPDPKAGT